MPRRKKNAGAQNSAPSEPPPRIPDPPPVEKITTPPGARLSNDMFTVRHLIDSFTTHVKLLVRAGLNAPATLGWYESQFAHLAALDGFPADALRTNHLAAIALTNAFVRVLKRLYKWGADEDLVPKDPFAKLTVPPCGQRERVLSRSELRRLYAASTRAFRRLLFVQLHTIARPGEIRQLTWAQIDWGKRVIVLVKFKGKLKRRDQLKARLIPLPLNVLRLLRNLHRKSKDPTPAGRVFISERGGRPWKPNGVRCAMRSARRRAGLDGGGEQVVCYSLRHTSATEAARGGENLKLLAEMMGHANTKTTERYVHLASEDLVGGIDRLSARRPRKPDPPAAAG